ncbi:LysM peptidoglycan-binding domain-containing protein [Haloechinothrix sp. YIM 98757]|uniref:LysM peptidoglycan-binding domain-containing protein n=1 Tax=Haloechinothrix aidingensis TaxID=2752311 RepID=A0A838ADS3_9PSEU|nr:LysM peptidoglycan-binding domain-containing protein [Haloechinothrix aidingensis]MBA0127278.1 LysM peptidoglycan-binding domain-containing protein [Haloechinothrix aidingensis]
MSLETFTARRLIRAAAAVAALTTLVLGYPLGLWHLLGADPRMLIPHSWPATEELPAWLWHQALWGWRTGRLLTHLLVVAAWAAWGVFLLLTLTEFVTQLHRGTSAARRGHRGPRRWIAALVTAILLSGVSNPALASTPATDVVVTAPQHPPPDHASPTDHTHSADTAQSEPEAPTDRCRRITVVAGDTLWGLAADHLGHGARYPEILALNRDRLTSGADHLEIGWQLLLPPDATQLADDTDTPCPDQRTVTVQPGETLSTIAARELGDPTQWTVLFELNRRQPQPDGRALLHADIILPGWTLHIPTATERGDDTEASGPIDEPASGTGTDTLPEAPIPNQQAPDRSVTLDPETSTTPDDSSAIVLWSGGLVAASLATAIVAAMLRKRRRRDRTYLPGSGDRTPPPPPAPAVHALRLAYDRAQVEAEPEDAHSTRPSGGDHQPHTEHEECNRHPEATANTLEIGVSDHHVRVLDIAAVQGLGVTGAGAQATVRALLVHLLGTTHATAVVPTDTAQALIGTELPESARLHITDSLESAIAELDARSPTTITTPQDGVIDTVLVATVNGSHQQLQSLLHVGRTTGIFYGYWPDGATLRVNSDGIVTSASPAIDDLVGSRLFHLDASDTRDLVALLADSRRAQELPSNKADEALNDTHEPTKTSDTGSDTHRSAEDTSSTRAVEASPQRDGSARHQQAPSTPWRLSIFGPVTLTWQPPHGDEYELTSVLAPKHKALLVFLALHPTGTTRAALREALWPNVRGRRPYNAYYATLSQLRKALTEAADSDAPELIEQRDEHVGLHRTRVDVDYWRLEQAEHDRRNAATDDQRMAAWTRIAAAYRGDIADGMSALWLDGPREAARRTAVDALAGMASYYRDRDPQRQLQVLEHARTINPENENIYRDIMRVQAKLGLPDSISRTVQLLTSKLAEIGERPESDTLTLARALQKQ